MPSNPPLAVPNELRDFSIPNKCKGVIYFYFRESGNKKRNLFIRGRKKRNLFKRRRGACSSEETKAIPLFSGSRMKLEVKLEVHQQAHRCSITEG